MATPPDPMPETGASSCNSGSRLATPSGEMLHVYFDFWATFWRRLAEAPPERSDTMSWIVQFGDVEKTLQEIHPDTGLPALIEPMKSRIEGALSGVDRRGLAIIFRLHPQRGLVHTVRGAASAVARVEQVLARQLRSSQP